MPNYSPYIWNIIKDLQAGHHFQLCADYRVKTAGYVGSSGFSQKISNRAVLRLFRDKVITYKEVLVYGIKWYVYELTDKGRALDVA
ncbi:hypothetical protein CS022_23040 [Veronia nyctiphanis]|uniref:Uncharacterized protein n=1 Tax=Veronia nyctiphanis TaxID=1278244 RepID=A0A4Q0YIG0_9GAMM|nr:hypothetical protein [Veronia nyctiphanis]RXJ70496.1 hypothetical protein CS022_23040 [Veronia nyctiphanis]